MKSKLRNLKALVAFKTIVSMLTITLSVFIIQSCVYNDAFGSDEIASPIEEDNFNGKICNGKKILTFATLLDLQQEHLNLYQHYMASNEDEQTLIDYENTANFYSLRKKENDIDDGIIPDDPNFDETVYTFDPVFETLLNEDGMIIIGERLYLWDSGCIIQSIPFSCENYEVLLKFRTAALNNDTATMHQLFSNFGIQNLNTCDNPQYDFETISENGGRVDDRDIPKLKNKNGCGYSIVLNKELISCVNGRNIFQISFESIEPLGSTMPLNLFYVSGALGDLDDLEFALQNIPSQFAAIPLTNEDQNYGYLLPFTGTFFMSAPQTQGMQIGITLSSSINIATGNSCTALEAFNINISCPLGIVATKINYSSSSAKWLFTFPVNQACGNVVQKITWDFGDGTPPVTGSTSIIHEFNQPCFETTFVVTATVSGTLCGSNVGGDLALSFTKEIPAGDPCNRLSYKFPTYKDNVNGKKLKLAAKIKNRNGKTIFKNVFKWRVTGDKTIKSIGYVYSPTANNSSCTQVDIANLVPVKTTSNKNRNKQKEKIFSINHINASNTYSVQFTHSNGYSHTLTASNLYCSQ